MGDDRKGEPKKNTQGQRKIGRETPKQGKEQPTMVDVRAGEKE